MQESALNHDELRLINALQICPRIGWSALSHIIGGDATTLARRWSRLSEQGFTWTAAYATGPWAPATAFIEISCRPSGIAELCERLSRLPKVLTIDVTAGNRDVFVTIFDESFAAISELVLDTIGTFPDILGMRTQLATSALVDARNWRLNVLEPREAAELQSIRERDHQVLSARPRSAFAALDAPHREQLLRALRANARMTATEIADALGCTVSRARSILRAAQSSGALTFRTEIARQMTDTPVYAWLFYKVSRQRTGEVLQILAQMPENRLAAAVVGRYDIVQAVWVQSLDALRRLEEHMEQQLRVVLVDRSVVLRTPFHLQLTLDRDGRRVASHDA